MDIAASSVPRLAECPSGRDKGLSACRELKQQFSLPVRKLSNHSR